MRFVLFIYARRLFGILSWALLLFPALRLIIKIFECFLVLMVWASYADFEKPFWLKISRYRSAHLHEVRPPPCSVCLLAGPLLQLRRVMSCTVPELWQVLLLDFGWARGAFGRLVGLSRLRCTALVCNCRHMFAGCLHAKCMCM